MQLLVLFAIHPSGQFKIDENNFEIFTCSVWFISSMELLSKGGQKKGTS